MSDPFVPRPLHSGRVAFFPKEAPPPAKSRILTPSGAAGVIARHVAEQRPPCTLIALSSPLLQAPTPRLFGGEPRNRSSSRRQSVGVPTSRRAALSNVVKLSRKPKTRLLTQRYGPPKANSTIAAVSAYESPRTIDGACHASPLDRPRFTVLTPGSLQVHDETIVSGLEPFWKPLSQFVIVESVSEMGQIGTSCADTPRRLKSFLDIEMRGVRIAPPQRVDHQHFNSPQHLSRFAGDPLAIHDDAKRAGTETVRLDVAMREAEWVQLDAPRIDRLSGLERAQFYPRDARFRIQSNRRIEYVWKPRLEFLDVLARYVSRERGSAPQAEDPEIVDPVYMVRMQMGEEHGIDVADTGSDQLLAKLGGRVDQQDILFALDDQTVSRSVIARITRRTHRARTSDDRNSEARAAAEKTQAHDQMVSIRTMLVVPWTWKGMPAVTTTRSPVLAMPRLRISARPKRHISS